MAKKDPYKDFKPFEKDSGRTFSYKANSDGVNKELGPKIILPPKLKTPGQTGEPLAKGPKSEGKKGAPLPKGPRSEGKKGSPLAKAPLPQGKKGAPLAKAPITQAKRGQPLPKGLKPEGKRGLPIPKGPKPEGKRGLPIPRGPMPQGKRGEPLVQTAGGSYNDWPLSKFSFEIDVGGFTGKMAFQGMDGLGASVGKMEFRDGNSSKFYKQTRPTLTSYDPVTLKKGVFAGDTKLFDWFTNVSQGSMFSDMRTVSIHLSELEGNTIKHLFTWTLEKAYITKFTASNLDGEADTEIALEEVELTYQSFSMNAGEGLLGSLLSGGIGGLLGTVTGAISGAVSGGLSGNISGNISF